MTATTSSENDFSLLVVDMWWEQEIKDRERGFVIHVNGFYPGKYEKRDCQNNPRELQYPHGTLHAGLDTIHDVVRMAHLLRKNIYGVVSDDGYSPADELLDKSLHPYISKDNLFMKKGYNAFDSKNLVKRLEEDDTSRLMVVGFDRDVCIPDTIKGAIDNGIEVITSEVLMLTCDRGDRDKALEYFRKNTTYLDSLVDVWNFLDPKGELEYYP